MLQNIGYIRPIVSRNRIIISDHHKDNRHAKSSDPRTRAAYYTLLTREAARTALAEAERCTEALRARVSAAQAEEASPRKAAMQEQTVRDSAPRRPTVTILDNTGGLNPTGVGLLQGAEMMQGVDHTPQPSTAALDRWTLAVSRRQSLEALLAAAMGDLESARHDFTHAEA